MRKLFRRIHYLLHRRRLERQLEDEMAAHREMTAPGRRGAFGNTLRLREEIRDTWGWLWLDHLRQDLFYAARGFIREPPADVQTLVVAGGARWTAAGVAIGLGASLLVLRLLQSLLYQVQAFDLRVLAGAAALLTTVAILAAWIPARRAAPRLSNRKKISVAIKPFLA